MFDLENKSIRVRRMRLEHHTFSHNLYRSHNFKLCLVTDGSALWQIGERMYTVGPNDVVVLSNRVKRVFQEVYSDTGIELLTLEFDPALFQNQMPGLFVGKEQEWEPVIPGQSDMIRLFQEIDREEALRGSYFGMAVSAKLAELLILILRSLHISDTAHVKMNGDMYKTLTYIDHYYMTDISLKEAAEMTNMSVSGFSRYFSKCMGTGFAQYIMHKRIHHAVYLLQYSEKTVLDIALECGFHNTASFYKAFKKVTNMKPGDYRNPGEEKYNI